MKKKLISLAVAGALATPMVASAQDTNVTLFGSAQAEYSTVDLEGFSSQALIGDPTNRTRWGLNVTEHLGNGFKAKAHIEYGLNTGNGSLGVARERWVALANDLWGEMKFGRVQSPFKDFAGGMTIDSFSYTSLQAGGSGGTMYSPANGLGSAANGFVNSAARYDSPSVEGFSFSGLLMPGDADKLDPTTALGNNNSTGFFGPSIGTDASGNPIYPTSNSGGEDGEWDFQVAGKYDMDFDGFGVAVFGGYSRDNVSTRQRTLYNVHDDEEVWRAGASFNVANFRLSGQYENINNAVGAATCTEAAAMGSIGDPRAQCNSAINLNGDGQIWFAGAEYKLGNTSLIGQGGITHANNLSSTALGLGQASREARSWTVGVIHHLSQRSSLFGGYQHVNVDDKTPGLADRDRNTYTVGVRHNF